MNPLLTGIAIGFVIGAAVATIYLTAWKQFKNLRQLDKEEKQRKAAHPSATPYKTNKNK